MAFSREPSFRTVRVREGYDLDDVDGFVDRVLETLAGRAGSRALTPEAIEAYDFAVVRWREAYLMDDVDDWLDGAAAELRRRTRLETARAVPEQRVQRQLQTVGAAAAPAAASVAAPAPPAPQPATFAPAPAASDPWTGFVESWGRPAHGRPVADIPTPTTGLHHLEIWVDDVTVAARSFGWLFERLGWTLFQVWEHGRSWQAPGEGPYVVLESSPELRRGPYDRRRSGLNHLALAVPARWMVDRIVVEAPSYGWRLLFADRHPYAGGSNHYAAYLENDEGFEVEVVAP
jgi:catechol 2,3-dioxygenase-like lactoylglutathione lyase family enzyme